jgi:hypothetical protein
VLVCNDPSGAINVIDSLPSNMCLQTNSVNRIKRLKKTSGLDFSSLKKTIDHQEASKALDKFYAS